MSLISSHDVLFLNLCGQDFVDINEFRNILNMLIFGKCGMLETNIFFKYPSFMCFMWARRLLYHFSNTLKRIIFLELVF